MLLTLDIETIPTDDPEVIAEIAAGITHPKNISKAETIAKWEAEEKPAAVAEAVARTAFDGGAGRIVCIGLAVDDGPAWSLCGPDEHEVLIGAFYDMNHAQRAYKGGGSESVVVVGHNVADFDLRFLWQRAVVHGLRLPSCLPRSPKPWDKTVGDTMVMWNPSREKRVSLDRLCKILGVPTSKGDMDGSKVAEAAAAGEWDKIARYCEADVVATRACYLKMAAA
jgi:hypothetical protein